MCEIPSWRLEPQPLPPTPYKHLYLWSDHRTKGAWWYHFFSLPCLYTFFFFFFFENHLYTFLNPTVIYIENTYNTNALRWDTIYLFLVYTPKENLIPPLYLYLKGSNSAHSLKTICHFHQLQEIEIIKHST